MKLSLTVRVPKVKGDPRAWWTADDTAAVAVSAVALIQRRTIRGIDAHGRPFVGYSTIGPIYINPNRGTGARLKPKGGQPTRIGRNPGRAGVSQKFRSYRDFKAKSRKPGQVNSVYAAASSEVDLVLSGRMLKSIRVREHSRMVALIGVGEETRSYAGAVHDKRPFMGLTDPDLELLLPGIEQRLAARLAKVFGGTP